MITVAGKTVYTTLQELVAPRHAALIVVDMQDDFCSPDGAFDRQGIDITAYPPVIGRLTTLIAGARAVGVPVVYVQMIALPDRMSDSPAQIRFNMRMHEDVLPENEPLEYTLKSTPGAEIISDLHPQPGDLVVQKYRSSAFWGTNLDMLLRSNGIETAIVTGCTTEGCVESTARDAMFNDYYVVIPEDCVASDDGAQHDASLFLMRHRFDVVCSPDILALWACGLEEAG